MYGFHSLTFRRFRKQTKKINLRQMFRNLDARLGGLDTPVFSILS